MAKLKACATCPLLSQQLQQVSDMVHHLEEDAVLAKVQADMVIAELQRELNNVLAENARIRKDYRDFLDQITWQKAELSG